jgi:DNA-binding IclR family transcriptional regulator
MDKTVLFEELKKAKARQYAMSEEEYLPGLITISAPLFDPLTGKGSVRSALIFRCFSTVQTMSRPNMAT